MNNYQINLLTGLPLTLLLAGSLALLPLTRPGLTAADGCKQACAQFYQCTVEMHGKTKAAKNKSKLIRGCLNTCRKQKKRVMVCYNRALKAPAANRCKDYGRCIMKAHKGS